MYRRRTRAWRPCPKVGATIKGVRWIPPNCRPHSPKNSIPRTGPKGSTSIARGHAPFSSISVQPFLTPKSYHIDFPPYPPIITSPSTTSTTPSPVEITSYPLEAPQAISRAVWSFPPRHYYHSNPSVPTSILLLERQSPIYSWNNDCPITHKFQTPTHIDLYDGMTNPQDHLESFQWSMLLSGALYLIMCHAFSITLKKVRLRWFTTLLTQSISYFKQLAKAFNTQFTTKSCSQENINSFSQFSTRKMRDTQRVLSSF